MSNNVTLIPKKPARHTLLTDTDYVVYMPLASKNTHGIVKIGDGLSIGSDGLLKLDFDSEWFGQINSKIDDVINNVIKIGDENNNFATKNAKIGENAVRAVAIGSGAQARLTASIAVGAGSIADFGGLAVGAGAKSNGSDSNAFGGEAEASGTKSLALGTMAKTSASFAVQLGQGTNRTAGTLQFRDFTIVDSNGKLKTNISTSSAPNMVDVATKSDVELNAQNIALKADISDLQNYYTKNETYTKQEINRLIVPTQGLRKEIVDELPEIGEDNVLYMVPKKDASGTDYYDEFLWVVDKFELVGSTQTKLEGYVTTEEFNKLVNNETQIKTTVDSFKAGGAISATNYAIAIGKDAKASGTNGVAIGRLSESAGGIGVGYAAKSQGYNSIQLGAGTNSTKNTLQIFKDNIYDHETHTATFENIEQNGNKVYGVLQGETAPTTETIGEVGQFYLDTTEKKLYQCTAVTTGDTTTYEWQAVGSGVSQEDFDKLVNNEIQINRAGSFLAGGGAKRNQYSAEAIAIGDGAVASSNSIALGSKAKANGSNSIALGTSGGLDAIASANSSIQIGTGTNNTTKTLQIHDDNIYNWGTHTLTVQNIELNGENLADKLESAGGTNIVSVEEDTITTNKLEKVVHLSEAQYQELITNGSIAIGEQTLTYDENTIYVTNDNASPLKELTLSGTSVLTSTETFNKHIQIMVEFETDSIHAGFDCVLHPYDEAVCFVTYDVLVNGQANFGTAYLDDAGHVVINVPSGLTFSNVHAKYCELNSHSGGSAEGGTESGGSADVISGITYQHNIAIKILNSGQETRITTMVVNSSADRITKTTLPTFLNENGFTNNTRIYPANGFTDMGSPCVGLFSEDGINISVTFYDLMATMVSSKILEGSQLFAVGDTVLEV